MSIKDKGMLIIGGWCISFILLLCGGCVLAYYIVTEDANSETTVTVRDTEYATEGKDPYYIEDIYSDFKKSDYNERLSSITLDKGGGETVYESDEFAALSNELNISTSTESSCTDFVDELIPNIDSDYFSVDMSNSIPLGRLVFVADDIEFTFNKDTEDWYLNKLVIDDLTGDGEKVSLSFEY